MEKVQAHDDETASGSNSGFSDLSILENDTDTLGRAILQHARDARRIQSVLHGSQKPFSKARPRQAASHRVQRQEMNRTAVNDQMPGRKPPSNQDQPEPPLNSRRDWGRKSAFDRARTIRSQGSAMPLSQRDGNGALTSERELDTDAIVPHRTAYTGDGYWSPNKAIPLDENTPPSMRRSRPLSQPTSLRHMNSRLQKIVQAEKQEFSDSSLLASTPAFSRQHKPLDKVVDAGVDSQLRLDKAAQESDSPYRRLPNDRIRLNRNPEASKKRDEAFLDSLPADTRPLAEFGRKVASDQIKERTSQRVALKSTSRPEYSRNDSMQLLRRLARVSSMSPSPARTTSDSGASKEEPKRLTSEDIQIDLIGRKRTDEECPTPTPKREVAVELNTPVVAGAWVGSPDVQTDLRPLLQTTDSNIERAFGSPSGSAVLEKFNESTDLKDNEQLRNQSEPSKRPRSALEEIVQEAKLHPDGQFGETTLQSLENIVHPIVDATGSSMLADDQVIKSTHVDGKELPDLTQVEKDRRQESLAIESMNKHLRVARSSIKDADRGLRRVETQIESSQETGNRPSMHQTSSIKRSDANGRTICEHCGGAYTSVWRGLWVEFRSNFYTWDPKSRLGIQLTWFGAILLFWCLWYLLESSLCLWYCQPLYAFKMVGYGVNPDAPRFPFVIPTLLFRPFKPLWLPVVKWLAGGCGILFHWIFGQTTKSGTYSRPGRLPYPARQPSLWANDVSIKDGSTHHSAQWISRTIAVAASATRRAGWSAMDAVDEVGRLWEEER